VLGLILRRLAQLPLILLAVYTLTITLAWWIPGNPLENPEGRRPPAEVVEAMKAQYNLDSFPRFYVSYLDNALGVKWARRALNGKAAAEERAAREAGHALPARPIFDLGPSLRYNDWTVNEIIRGTLPVSVSLGLLAILIALALGVSAGVVGAVRPNSWADTATLAVALPSFVIGTVLLMVFPVWLGWGTVAGDVRPSRLVWPALTLALPFAAYIARLTRMGMIEALSTDYIRTARAKGVPQSGVLLRHALKNAFLPVLSYLGPATALAMTGSFVVEQVFTIPGMGQFFVNAVQNKDLFLIIGVVLVFATMLILFNLAVDVLYRWVDPRIE
jgi:oligopeptide transport system permease protein